MTNVKVIHDTDIGANLEIAGGKLKAAETLATDLELSDAIIANNITDATEERQILDNIRYQDGILFTAPWELVGTKIKAYTNANIPANGYPRFLSIHTKAGHLNFMFPAAGGIVKGLGGLPDLTVDADGFVTLPALGVMWYKWVGAATGWYYSRYTSSFDATVEYIRVVGLGSDNGIVGHLADGTVINQGMNYPDRVTSVAGKRPVSNRRYVRNLGVFEGFIGGSATATASTIPAHLQDDFVGSVISPAATAGNTVVHFRLPLKAGTGVAAPDTNQMYHLHMTGHSHFGTKNVIDTTVVGYAYQTGLTQPKAEGTHAADVTQYVGSDNYVYVRVAFGHGYYLTVSIDSRGVGNGFPLKHGSIQAIINPAATL